METSMNAHPDLKFAIEWNRFTLLPLGIWPEQRNSKWNLNVNFILVMSMILGFIIIPQTVSLIMVWGNFELVIDNLLLGNIVGTTSVLKLFVIWYNRKVVRLLLDCVIEDWTSPKSELERKVMLKNATLSRRLTITCTFLIQTLILVHIGINVNINRQQVAKNNSNFTDWLLCQSYFPYDVEKSPNFEITIVGQGLAIAFSGVASIVIDCFLVALILHLCAQFTNLCFELKHLMSEVEYEKNVSFRKGFGTIINKHERLLSFAASVERTFNPMLLVQILASTLQFCLQGYRIMLMVNKKQIFVSQLIFLIMFVCSAGLQLFSYCYVGESLIAESVKPCYTAYQCDWYKLPVQDARDLMFMMLKSRKPLQITAGKLCSFSLSMFVSVITNSFKYMSVLLAVDEQLNK